MVMKYCYKGTLQDMIGKLSKRYGRAAELHFTLNELVEQYEGSVDGME